MTQYSKPAIVEAILDIRVELPGGFQRESFLKCHKRVKSKYPERKDAQRVTAQFSFGPEVGAASSSSTRNFGYVFRSADEKQSFQARLDGFTFNRLAPYPGWSSFVEEAKELWEEFRRVAHPVAYKRVAVRYINRFDFPGPSIDLSKYFRTNPQVAPELPQQLAGFFFQVQLPLQEIESLVIVTETAVPPPAPEPEQVSIVLDIDLFRTDNLPPGNELWSVFETFHEWKNRVFEACIADPIRELIR